MTLRVKLGPGGKDQLPLGMGGSFYGLDHRHHQGETDLWAALETALDCGITHFDTATDYADGASERLLGRFLAGVPGRRDRVFLASKANPDALSAQAVTQAVEASLKRLRTDVIDLYYLHWPRSGEDLRPWMEGLERARGQGMIRAAGVSNFSVAQMEQVAEVGRIDACQLGYNLLWRFPERNVLPYCVGRGIAVVAYSALAHGILSGRYGRTLDFAPGDQRWTISLFGSEVWPHVHHTVEAFRQVAEHHGRPLPTLALRWLLGRPAVTSVLVSAKNAGQARANALSLAVDVPEGLLDELTALSDRALDFVPDEGNPFGHHP